MLRAGDAMLRETKAMVRVTHPMVRIAVLLALCGLAAAPSAFAHGSVDARLTRVDARIAVDPANPGLHAERAGILLDYGQWQEAEAELAVVATLDPEIPALSLGRAVLFLETGRAEEALAVTAALVEREPELAEGHRQHGRALLRLGRSAEAADALALALRLDPAPIPDDFLELAALLPPGRESLGVLEDGLARLGPAVPLALTAIEIERKLGLWGEALTRISDLERFYARPEPLLELRARIHLEANEPGEARTALLELLRLLDERAATGRSTVADREREARSRILLEQCAVALTEPASTEPTTEPVLTEPAPTEPASTEPRTQPVPTPIHTSRTQDAP